MITVADHFYILREAAERIGVERHTVWRWIRDGKLQAQKVGGVVLIEKRTVEQLARQRVLEGAVE